MSGLLPHILPLAIRGMPRVQRHSAARAATRLALVSASRVRRKHPSAPVSRVHSVASCHILGKVPGQVGERRGHV